MTYQGHRARVINIKMMTRSSRFLVLGMWLAVATGALSSLWSVDPILTLQQSAALAVLAGTIHAVLSRRWTNKRFIEGDLAVAYWVLIAFFALGFVGRAIGLPGTQSVAGFNGFQLVELRYQGLAGNPNMLAVLGVPTIPIGWHLWLHYRKVSYLLGLVPAIFSVLMSQSRTAMLAIAGGALLALLRRGPRVAFSATAAGTVLIGLGYASGVVGLVLSSQLLNSIADRFESREGGGVLNGRTAAWAETAGLIQQRPVTGWGYSAGPRLFEQLRASGDLAFGRDVVHNSYLQWLLETGAIGIAAILALVVACLIAAWKCSAQGRTSGLAWCLIAGLVMQFTESAMLGTGQAYPVVFWVAAAAATTHAIHDAATPALAHAR
ncbi:O-antigen ligase family protein [Krasilnikovia cinnamomea]|uniref:O-antigen ligase family protein n=1 Tax=Krasilnikovia cinnamomea TaxID=349313 RepID=UPI0013EF3ADC|nr:O-antigen ligase family protein [Krasilnikovia cinnamomea]